MNPLNLDEVCEFVNENIVGFHRSRIKAVEELSLHKLLKKNPYLLKAKNLIAPYDLIGSLFDAFLSSSEEKSFGDFLEGLAIFIAKKTNSGHKSSAPGIDLEFINKGIHYLVSIKSSTNWGNSSQQDRLEQDMKNATIRLKQSRFGMNVQPVLGICYGRTGTSYVRGYLKVVGQNFWYLISENKNLYTDIIEPIGYHAQEHTESFIIEKTSLVSRLTRQFFDEFCTPDLKIDWVKLVEFNSGNFDLDHFGKE